MIQFHVYPEGKKRIVTFSYDDGPACDKRLVDLFNKYKVKGTFHLNGGEASEETIAELRERGLTYPCFCTRAELHAAAAPHASDGTYIYQGTCRHLTKSSYTSLFFNNPYATI